MNIIQFLDEVGHTKLCFQMLHECVLGATKRKAGFTEVRFATKELQVSDLMGHPRRVGVIVWMDFEDYERARKAL